MAALNPPPCTTNWPAAAFDLQGTDGQRHTLASTRGPNGLLVAFICNHCPYVQAILDRLIRDCRELAQLGVGSVAIMPNDTIAYPADSFENMRRLALEKQLPFPYLYDADQSVARAYGAVCTPDFFGFNADLRLQYRGRLDASRKELAPADARRELFEAMRMISGSGQGPAEQNASIGCSIKWAGEA